MISTLVVPADTVIIGHFQAINVSQQLWGEDAAEWKPDRWLAPLPAVLEETRIPGVYAHL